MQFMGKYGAGLLKSREWTYRQRKGRVVNNGLLIACQNRLRFDSRMSCSLFDAAIALGAFGSRAEAVRVAIENFVPDLRSQAIDRQIVDGFARVAQDVSPGHDFKGRPFLVITRNSAISVLSRITLAPISTTIRSIPTEVPLGVDDGLYTDCVATFDNLVVGPKSALVRRLGSIPPSRASAICAALNAAFDC
jgi:mRNA interferase MazF